MFSLSGLFRTFALALGAGAFFAFGAGFIVSQVRGMVREIDAKGYERGASDLALKYAVEAEALRKELNQAADERAAEIQARLTQSENRALEAENRANQALEELIKSDTAFAQCEAQALPDSVRAHFPGGMLPAGEAAATNRADG